MKYNIKLTFLTSTLLLAGCSSMNTGMDNSVIKNSFQDSPLAQTINAIASSAVTQPVFNYRLNDTAYSAYQVAGQPTFVEKNENGNTEKFYYQNGALIASQDANGIYEFAKGQLSQAYSVAGQELDAKAPELQAQATSLYAQSKKAYKILSQNSAEKNAEDVRTGDDAKLNYLCISKVQQVAGTRRVFRNSANTSKVKTQLISSVRLNGKNFYNMNCQIEDNRVSSLTLSAK